MRLSIYFLAALFVFVMFRAPTVWAVNWIRNGEVVEKELNDSNGKPKVFGYLTFPPYNQNNCNWEGGDGDLALNFDVSVLARLAGNSFDVDKLYFDGVFAGEWALDAWFLSWGKNSIPPLNGYDWKNRNIISFCVGAIAQGVTGGGNALQSIVLWYDGPIESPIHRPTPEPYNENSPKNMADTNDSIVVSGNGLTARDTRVLPPSGSSSQSITGTRVDLKPDFDVYDTSGNEISANCNNCAGKPVDVGQIIRAKLWTEVSNSDASGFKRDSNSDSIEGPVWWKIEGKTGWNLLASGEYTIGNLNRGGRTVESHDWAVPNYPGDVLAMQACVDGDDEIWEEGESSTKHKIASPDQSDTSNNCSRIERFYIEHPNYLPTGAIESGDCTRVQGWAKDQNTSGSIMIHAYISEADGSNEQYLETFMADKLRMELGGNFGIEWSVPNSIKTWVSKKITFHAVNTPRGQNTVIGSVTLACAPPTFSPRDAGIWLLLHQ